MFVTLLVIVLLFSDSTSSLAKTALYFSSLASMYAKWRLEIAHCKNHNITTIVAQTIPGRAKDSATQTEYLGRYTHKIAISNHRIKSIDNQNVTFEYKDYRMAGAKKQMTLTHGEFIRRFSLHILPKRFVKIRHYGFLSSTWKRQKLKLLQEKLKVKVLDKVEKKPFLPKCPCCKTGNLHRTAVFDQRGPPAWYLVDSQSSNSCIN